MMQAIVGLARRVLGSPSTAVAPASRPLAMQAGPPGSPAGASQGFARLLGPGPHGPAASVPGPPPALRRPERERRSSTDADALPPAPQDPSLAVPPMAFVGPTAAPPAAPSGPAAAGQAALALQDLWPALVRRVAWEGDGQRGSVRLELGAGALAGATLLLRCEAGRVGVTLSDPAGADLDAWRARIGARLLAAGLEVDGVD